MKNQINKFNRYPKLRTPRSKAKVVGLLLVLLALVLVLVKILLTGQKEETFKLSSTGESKQTQEVAITDSLISKVKNEIKPAGYFSDFYNSVTVFPDLASYLGSEEKRGKLQSEVLPVEITSQLSSIKEGEIITFMAPARVDSQEQAEDVFIPIISLKKDGEKVTVESVGEYWNILQDNLDKLKSNYNYTADGELEKLLEENGKDKSQNESPYAIISAKGGDTLSQPQEGVSLIGHVLAGVSRTLSDEIKKEQANGSRVKESRLSNLLTSLLLSAANSQDYTKKIGEILASVANTSGTLFLETEEVNNYYATAEARCEKSGGQWFFEECQKCAAGSILDIDGYCKSEDKLKKVCERSGGSWTDKTDYSNLPEICGGKRAFIDQPSQETQNSASQSSYCDCPQGSCLGSGGLCYTGKEDNDEDGIANKDDHCPDVGFSQTSPVNNKIGSEYYGCSCEQIGTVMKNCPSNKCVGSRWVTYSKGKQECKDGQLLPYTCNVDGYDTNKFCLSPVNSNQLSLLPKDSNVNASVVESSGDSKEAATNDQEEGTKNTADSKTNDFPINLNMNSGSPIVSKNDQNDNNGGYRYESPKAVTGNATAKSGGSGSAMGVSTAPIGGAKGPIVKHDWSKELPTVTAVSGQQQYGSGGGNPGGSGGIIEGLRAIYNRDYATYAMIFHYLRELKHMSGGGVCNGCGLAKVDYTAPTMVLAQIIVHEMMHCGQDCVGGFGGFTRRELERIAVEKQIGSAHFEKKIATTKGSIYNLMEEFPSQRSQYVLSAGKSVGRPNGGFPVRGFLARYWCSTLAQPKSCNGQGGDDFDLGNNTVFLDWLFNQAGFSSWPFYPVYSAQAYEPRSGNPQNFYFGTQPGDCNWGIYYATESKMVPGPPDTTYGGYPYGFGDSVLGAKPKEEAVIRRAQAFSNQNIYTPCQSSPEGLGLPPVFGCEGAPTLVID